VSHDDLRPENILVSESGEVYLVDFDQATTGAFWRCLVRSLLGLRAGGPPVQNGILAPARERLQASLSPRVIRWLKRQRLGAIVGAASQMPALPPDAGLRLRALHRAWRLASTSDASAPGQAIAYYALEIECVRLPGERPWAERWRLLGGIADCAGKRVLELGCNMALLSVHLLRESGAAAALAVDRDPAILEAAAEIAAAFEVPTELREVDIDGDADWETALSAFSPDVVFCLSVLHWVRDKARLLAFLGRFEELVYEGHDSARSECRRLRAAGYQSIRLVATSERGRPILHCRKDMNR
ncbi:MAG: methyltransferase, partial [Geminicoccales bacterium]